MNNHVLVNFKIPDGSVDMLNVYPVPKVGEFVEMGNIDKNTITYRVSKVVHLYLFDESPEINVTLELI